MQQQINLFQPIFRKERKILSFDALLQISGIVLVALALLYAYGSWHNGRISKELGGMKIQHDERIAMLERISREASRRSNQDRTGEEIARLQAELAAERYIVSLLIIDKKGEEKTAKAKSREAAGFSQYLEIFSRRVVKGMSISQISVFDGGVHMLIKGKVSSADLLPEFLTGLGDEPLLNGLEFSVLRMSREESGKDWIEFMLSTNDLPEASARPLRNQRLQ